MTTELCEGHREKNCSPGAIRRRLKSSSTVIATARRMQRLEEKLVEGDQRENPPSGSAACRSCGGAAVRCARPR